MGDNLFASDDDRARLQAFFKQTDDAKVGQRWDDIWKEDFLPFDRNAPNPALDEALGKFAVSNSDTLPSPIDATTGSRRTAVVPGCGRGYDVLLLAAWGYDAVGLEISHTALVAAEKYAVGVERTLSENENDDNVAVYQTRDTTGKIGRGSARFVMGDFFGDPAEWKSIESPRRAYEEGLGPMPRKADLIVDYTFLCAFPPSWRPKWGATMRSLLKEATTSRLLCVEFPTYKDPTVRGPPWAMPTKAYLAILGRPGEEVKYDEGQRVILSEDDVQALEAGKSLVRDGMVRVEHYKCTKTHPVGKDTDHVGIWRKAKD